MDTLKVISALPIFIIGMTLPSYAAIEQSDIEAVGKEGYRFDARFEYNSPPLSTKGDNSYVTSLVRLQPPDSPIVFGFTKTSSFWKLDNNPRGPFDGLSPSIGLRGELFGSLKTEGRLEFQYAPTYGLFYPWPLNSIIEMRSSRHPWDVEGYFSSDLYSVSGSTTVGWMFGEKDGFRYSLIASGYDKYFLRHNIHLSQVGIGIRNSIDLFNMRLRTGLLYNLPVWPSNSDGLQFTFDILTL